MASGQFTDVQTRPTEFLDLTSLTLEEFQPLVPPFEAAFHAPMARWRRDGKPRTARQLTVDTNCPLPTPEDRLFFLLTYLTTYALQVVPGRLFGMGQRTAHQWIHGLLPALLAALRTLGEAPARARTALAPRLGGSEAEAATVVVPLEEAPAPVAAVPAATPASPLWPMTGRNGGSSAPKTRLNRPRVIAASKRTTRSTMSCSCMLCSRASFAVRHTVAASMISPWLPRRPPPDLPGGGCGRLWASSPARCPPWRSSCRPRSHEARN